MDGRTPVVVNDVHGLRDSVINGKTRVLTKKTNTPESLAEEAIHLLKDRASLTRLSLGALEDSRSYSWDRAAEEFESISER